MFFGRFNWPTLFRDPWLEFDREFDRLQRLQRLLMDGRTAEYPALNIWTGDEESWLVFELPGVSSDDIQLTIEGDSLTLKGSRKAHPLAEGESCIRNERFAGDFARVVRLPYQVNADEVEATFQNGLLRIRLPRAEADKPKKIAVKTA